MATATVVTMIPTTFHRSALWLPMLLLLMLQPLRSRYLVSAFTAIRPSTRSRNTFVASKTGSSSNEADKDTSHDDNGGQTKETCGSFVSKGVPSYSDNWLLNQHNQAQQEYQLKTNSLETYNRKLQDEQESIREWQEAFQRNGFADFTPPMSSGLNCLMVGTDVQIPTRQNESHRPRDWTLGGTAKLPWENESEAVTTFLLKGAGAPHDSSAMIVLEDDKVVKDEPITASLAKSSNIIPTVDPTEPAPFDSSSSDSSSGTTADDGLSVAPKGRAAVYDCIVDEGLLASVLLLQNDDNNAERNNRTTTTRMIRELLNEAAVSLREHGIYVLTTYDQSQLTEDAKELLEQFGKEAGFEWGFQLDGISDENQQVSIARRFNTGVMPSVGKLSNTRSFFSK